jgi:hypothetical protein
MLGDIRYAFRTLAANPGFAPPLASEVAVRRRWGVRGTTSPGMK